MRKIVIIGIGAGNPDHMTVQAVKALNGVDVVLIPRKGAAKDELAQLRRDICDRFLENPSTDIVEFDYPVRDAATPSYVTGVKDWHAGIAGIYHTLLEAHTAPDGSAALLVWGDPSLYDSTLRIFELLAQTGFPFELEVIPGITSVQALAASHKIALNTVGNPFQITTGRQLKNGFPDGVDTAVIMLDGNLSIDHLDGEAFDVFWGAYLGTEAEIVISGKLADVAETIKQTRTAARAEHAWIMDTYLLRRIVIVAQI